jgi:hypothetical protein
VHLNVTSESDRAETITQTEEHVAPLDILINNAAYPSIGTTENVALDKFQRVVDTNPTGALPGIIETPLAYDPEATNWYRSTASPSPAEPPRTRSPTSTSPPPPTTHTSQPAPKSSPTAASDSAPSPDSHFDG